MTFEVLVTAVSERADLFIETVTSMLTMLDVAPSRLVVHEDVRAGSAPGAIEAWLAQCGVPYKHKVASPSRGLGPAMSWCFRQAATPVVFYTQEDWLFTRPVPVARCLEIMDANAINHVRFNKRKTMRAKHADTDHPWHKVEVTFADARGEAQTFCISDHWYTQASLWRVAPALESVVTVAESRPQANEFVAAFNHRMNLKYIKDPARVQDQGERHAKMRTYIWGPVGEPAFIKHLGSARTTGPIVHLREIENLRRGGR